MASKFAFRDAVFALNSSLVRFNRVIGAELSPATTPAIDEKLFRFRSSWTGDQRLCISLVIAGILRGITRATAMSGTYDGGLNEVLHDRGSDFDVLGAQDLKGYPSGHTISSQDDPADVWSSFRSIRSCPGLVQTFYSFDTLKME